MRIDTLALADSADCPLWRCLVDWASNLSGFRYSEATRNLVTLRERYV